MIGRVLLSKNLNQADNSQQKTGNAIAARNGQDVNSGHAGSVVRLAPLTVDSQYFELLVVEFASLSEPGLFTK